MGLCLGVEKKCSNQRDITAYSLKLTETQLLPLASNTPINKMAKRNADNETTEHFKRRRSEGPVPTLFHIFHGEVSVYIKKIAKLFPLFPVFCLDKESCKRQNLIFARF